jgi:hypothetical protein
VRDVFRGRARGLARLQEREIHDLSNAQAAGFPAIEEMRRSGFVFAGRNAVLSQELLDIIETKSHDPANQVTGQLAGFHHTIDGHFIELKEIRELGYGVEFART